MSDAVDSHTTFKTNSHTANRSARFTGDRLSKSFYARVENSRSDGRTFVHGDADLIDAECDQCSVIVRDGE